MESEIRFMWLSIVIPLYNCGEFVSACLDSILRQGLSREEYEVIVINDGSTDGGEKVVESYCKQHPNFRLINQSNQGVSAARNAGMANAQGEYILFCDPDDGLVNGGGENAERLLFCG